LKVTIARSFPSNIEHEQEVWVINYGESPEMNQSIKMEVGIEDCLHIEFEYGRSKYHLKDVIVGKIFFLLVRIKIKYMEIALIKRESTGSPPNVYNESETITKFEIMDGAPVRGESIPIRLFLSAFDLTPTYKNVHSKFSVKYYLNLVLVDEDDRRYFKQTDITLWRKRAGLEEKRVMTVKDIPETTREKKKRQKREKKALEEAEGKAAPQGDNGAPGEATHSDAPAAAARDDGEEKKKKKKKEKKEKAAGKTPAEEADQAAAQPKEMSDGNDDEAVVEIKQAAPEGSA